MYTNGSLVSDRLQPHSTTMECPICVSVYTKNRSKIECPSCQHEACASCVRHYLLENTIEPKCMHCSVRWNMEFIRSRLSVSFLNKEYRKKQEASLTAEAETRFDEFNRILQKENKIEAVRKEMREIEDQMTTLKKLLNARTTEYWRLKSSSDAPAQERQEFFMACPRTECRGRVSSAYKCGLCEHWICPDCHGDKGLERHSEHECKDDDKKTVEVLRENTKPCPKCHTGIFKVSGCDQMWCVSCHTCFSWGSGKILTGRVHNPHFYEFLRQTNGGEAPRNALDIPCGGVPHIHQLRNHIKTFPDVDQAKIRHCHRMIIHLEEITLPRLERLRHRDDVHLGVSYLRGTISREEWGRQMFLLKRKGEKGQRYLDVVQMLVGTGGDIFRNILSDTSPSKDIVAHIDNLIAYTNEQIRVINRQYGSSLPSFQYDLQAYPF